MAAQKDGRARTDREQMLDRFEIFQVLLILEIEVGGVRREEETDVLAQERIGFDRSGAG